MTISQTLTVLGLLFEFISVSFTFVKLFRGRFSQMIEYGIKKEEKIG